MRIFYLWLFLQIFFIGNLLFNNTADPNAVDPNIYSGADNSDTAWSFWNLLINPSNWSETVLITFFITSLVSITAITVGASILTKFDIVILFPLFVLLLLTGAPAIISMYQLFNNFATSYVCSIGNPAGEEIRACFATTLFGIIPIIVAGAWLFVCIEWWTNRPTT